MRVPVNVCVHMCVCACDTTQTLSGPLQRRHVTHGPQFLSDILHQHPDVGPFAHLRVRGTHGATSLRINKKVKHSCFEFDMT